MFFQMNDIGKTKYILGIKIYRDRSQRLIGLIQCVYIDKSQKGSVQEKSKRRSVPMSVSVQSIAKPYARDRVRKQNTCRSALCRLHHVCYNMHQTKCQECSKDDQLSSGYNRTRALINSEELFGTLKRPRIKFLSVEIKQDLIAKDNTDANCVTKLDN